MWDFNYWKVGNNLELYRNVQGVMGDSLRSDLSEVLYVDGQIHIVWESRTLDSEINSGKISVDKG